MINSKQVVWAPDGDEAFDDGSYILQFDIGNYVRVIAFKSDQSNPYDPATIRDVRVKLDDFYAILESWHDAFENEWTSLPKVPA